MSFLKKISKYFTPKKTDKNAGGILESWEAAGKPVPPPHLVKQLIISGLQKKSGYRIFIETGTYLGEMVEAQKNNFDQVYSVELSQALFTAAQQKFSGHANVNIIQGDSGEVLPALMRQINEPAVFWLDGHYSAGITAKGSKDCPIFEELTAIFNAKPLKHILLIDDARLFTGDNDYPDHDELIDFIEGHSPSMESFIKDDIIHIYL